MEEGGARTPKAAHSPAQSGPGRPPGTGPSPPILAVILEKPIRIPRFLSVKASHVLKGFLNKVSS